MFTLYIQNHHIVFLLQWQCACRESAPQQPRERARGKGSRGPRQKTIRGYGAKLDCVNSKPSPSLRVFDVAAGWSGWVEWRAVRRTWRKARSGGLTWGVSGSGVAPALPSWPVAKTVPCRGRKWGNPSPGQRGSRFLSVQRACGGDFFPQ